MIAPAAPRPAPLARVRLERVRARSFAAPAPARVFHVFEELSRRTLEQRPAGPAASRAAPRA